MVDYITATKPANSRRLGLLHQQFGRRRLKRIESRDRVEPNRMRFSYRGPIFFSAFLARFSITRHGTAEQNRLTWPSVHRSSAAWFCDRPAAPLPEAIRRGGPFPAV